MKNEYTNVMQNNGTHSYIWSVLLTAANQNNVKEKTLRQVSVKTQEGVKTRDQLFVSIDT